MPACAWSVLWRGKRTQGKALTYSGDWSNAWSVTSGTCHLLLHLLLSPVSCWMKDLPQYPGGPEFPVWKLAEGEFLLPQKHESILTRNMKEHGPWNLFLPLVGSGMFWAFSSWKFSVKTNVKGDKISLRTSTAGRNTKEWWIFSDREVLPNLRWIVPRTDQKEEFWPRGQFMQSTNGERQCYFHLQNPRVSLLHFHNHQIRIRC